VEHYRDHVKGGGESLRSTLTSRRASAPGWRRPRSLACLPLAAQTGRLTPDRSPDVRIAFRPPPAQNPMSGWAHGL
jgi:hypothetical protein